MQKKYLPLIIFLFLFAAPVAAHPPSGIVPQYDVANGMVLLEIRHLSQDKFDHYIEKVTVTKNDDSPITKSQKVQKHPNSLYVEIPLTLEEGDIVHISADSKEGGSKELTWEITQDVLDAEFIPKKKYSQAAPAVPKDQSKVKPAVPQDPDVSKATHPRDSDAYKPAITVDRSVAKSTHPDDPKAYKPALTLDPDVAKSALPTSSTKTQAATPNTRTIQKGSY